MRGFLRTSVWLLGIAGAICLLFYLFVFDVWVVPHGPDGQFSTSILPLLMPEDKLLVRRGSSPRNGELARCASPTTAGEFVVGRVFGLGGDHVEVSDGVITTNGKPIAARHGCPQVVVAHPVTGDLVTMNCGVADTGAWTFSYLTNPEMSGGQSSAVVGEGKAYLVSDNRLMHQDSRDFGQVDVSTCEHIVFRLWGERYMNAERRFDLIW